MCRVLARFCKWIRRSTGCATRYVQRHLAETSAGAQNFDVLLMAQALERIGDHAKNLAEELIGLAEGRSLRHSAKRPNYA